MTIVRLTMTIVVKQRDIYGNIRFYPINDMAQRFANLMRQKTFDAGNLREIKDMGVEIEIATDLVKI